MAREQQAGEGGREGGGEGRGEGGGEGGGERERHSIFTGSCAGARKTILCSSDTLRGDTGGSKKGLHQSAQDNVLLLLRLLAQWN